MHQDNWLHPSLADGWSAWASDTAPAAQPAPRSRVALGAAVPITAAFNGSQGLARVGRAVLLGGTNADVWGDAARQSATASVTRAALAAGQGLATPSTRSLTTQRRAACPAAHLRVHRAWRAQRHVVHHRQALSLHRARRTAAG